MKYSPHAPLAERLQALRNAVSRDKCSHDFVCVQGATICANCGADLNKMLDEYRKTMADDTRGYRLSVTTPTKVVELPTPPAWALYIAAAALYIAAAAVGTAAAIGFVELFKFVMGLK